MLVRFPVVDVQQAQQQTKDVWAGYTESRA